MKNNRTFLEKLLDGAEVEWKTVKSLCNDNFWLMPATPEFDDNGNIPYITSKNIKGGKIDFQNTKYINEYVYQELSRTRCIIENDILISMIGTIGEAVIVKKEDLYFYGQNMYVLRLNNELVNHKFFLYYFTAPFILNSLLSKKNSSNQGYLKAGQIESLKIPIPPLSVQTEIVKILDALTALTSELTSELILRQKQYEYYREKLLDGAEVKWIPLGDVADYEQPTKYLVNSTVYNDNYPTPVLTAGKTFILGYTNEDEGIYFASKSPVIIFDDFTTANKWVDFDFKAKSSAMKMITSKNEKFALLKYIYYWLNTLPNNQTDGDHKRQWISNYANKLIPIPPLSVQTEIVKILDKFETLTNSITEGLPLAIEQSQKRYEYYRELLLNFPGRE
ncbi:TPA: restriction endonuclease subunit S [Haemophilus influenzae]|uniref:restriction endonuclease subunit S n=1 Tax=Haemophilus influenzae TaxID=727 RepID=UPI000E571F95|nr:restriction endonuclease subunit S [Haemophilus influenzae]